MTDHISQFKAILFLDRKTSKIFLGNEKVNLSFKLRDLQFSQVFDNIITLLVMRRGLDAETSIKKVHIATNAPIVI